MALQTTAIATSIAGYSVSGVTIRDLDDFQDEIKKRSGDLPVLMPAPNFFTAPKIEYMAMGTGDVAPINVTYTLNYRFFYEEVGAERELANIFQGFIGKVTAIIDAIIANDSTSNAIHLQVVSISPFGVVVDPSGNEFFGCDFGFGVLEFVN
jgi:hypothetical protein